jgi:hypothetical protein
MNRLVHDASDEVREKRTRIGVVTTGADSSKMRVEPAQIFLFTIGVILPAPSCVIGE